MKSKELSKSYYCPEHISQPHHYLGGISKAPPTINWAEKNRCCRDQLTWSLIWSAGVQRKTKRGRTGCLHLSFPGFRATWHFIRRTSVARHLSSDVLESGRRPREFSAFPMIFINPTPRMGEGGIVLSPNWGRKIVCHGQAEGGWWDRRTLTRKGTGLASGHSSGSPLLGTLICILKWVWIRWFSPSSSYSLRLIFWTVENVFRALASLFPRLNICRVKGGF